ncbi:MAG: endoglucanase [Actinomycetota bacterium]|nr:endoglucanase [Actinomycetota bacterium]
MFRSFLRRHRPRRTRRPLALALPVSLVAAVVGGSVVGGVVIGDAPPAHAATLASTPHYNLSLALQQSLFFYDAEKSGPARTLGRQPLEWRGDSEPSDSAVPLKPIKDWEGTNLSAAFIAANKTVLDPDGDGIVDLSGGFHDAGDHVKFGLPQAYAAGTIAWGMLEFPEAFVATKSWDHSMEEMRWFTDYFLRSLFTDKAGNVVAFNYQVGDGSVDHAYWGSPELQDPKLYKRPAYFATSETPASDQTASHAAAFAMMSMLTKEADPAYAARCLAAAKALYAFSVEHRGLGYSGGFYGSSFDEDEMSWGAAWLFKATGDRKYLNDILAIDDKGTYTGYLKTLIGNSTNTWVNIWVHSWDTKWGGVFSVLDPIVTADTQLPAKVRKDVHFWDKWQVEYWSHTPRDDKSDTTYLATSPGGFAYLNGWGSARYNTAAQLEALAYRKHFPDDPSSAAFTDWAMGQMNYIMGDNPLSRSFIVGFGSDVPGVGDLVGGTAKAARHPHHAAAHGSTTNNQDDPAENAHTLWGGLVGGPGMKDEHVDIVSDYVYNEVAVDYNAAMVGALAGLWTYYGAGQRNEVFTPPKEPEKIDFFPYAKMVQATSRASQISVTINNFANRPPHYQRDLSARYFFDISELHKRGQTIADVSTEIYYDAGAANRNQPAKVSKPVRWGGENSCVHYVTIDWSGTDVVGASELQFGLIAAQSTDYKTYWDASNDFSYAGLTDGTYAKALDPNIPVYQGGKLYYGKEPRTDLNDTCGGTPPDGPDTGTPTLTAQYARSAQSSSERIANEIQVTNTGTSVADLSQITVRYWFTSEPTTTLTYACDYAPVNCANVTGKIVAVAPPVTGADRYVELGFAGKAGKLYPGAATGPIQSRIQADQGATFDQSNDYSYPAKSTGLADTTTITVYYKGTLVYGTPPKA